MIIIMVIDKKIYSDSVISKAVYWMSGDYKIVRESLDESTERLDFTAINKDVLDSSAEVKFNQLLNDFKLRQIVADETRDIKTILYAKAFAEDEDLSEEDIHD